MDLDKLNISNAVYLDDSSNININTQEFYRIAEIIKLAFKEIGINAEDMQIYYQRNFDATSILAIKVSEGDYNDIKNYMLNGCQTWYHDDSVSCDVYLHSNAKSAQRSMKLANLISRDIVLFFEKTEEYFLKNNKKELSLYLQLSLGVKQEKNCFKGLMRRILKQR